VQYSSRPTGNRDPNSVKFPENSVVRLQRAFNFGRAFGPAPQPCLQRRRSNTRRLGRFKTIDAVKKALNPNLFPMSIPLHSSCAAPVAVEGCVEFYVGNPQVSITPGTLHLFKSWSVQPDTLQVIVRPSFRHVIARVYHCVRRLLCCQCPPTSLCRTSSGF
jgi:hypothetical protein